VCVCVCVCVCVLSLLSFSLPLFLVTSIQSIESVFSWSPLSNVLICFLFPDVV
jgi:hypothetical protein